jgi:hypothetical protein
MSQMNDRMNHHLSDEELATVLAALRFWQRDIKYALCRLRITRDMLRACGSKPAADYVSRAIKSAEGAFNHAQRRANEATGD